MVHPYITESMAQVGCGAGDIPEIAKIADTMDAKSRDVLDCMHNLGVNTEMGAGFKAAELALREEYDEGTLVVLGAYVSAMRSIGDY